MPTFLCAAKNECDLSNRAMSPAIHPALEKSGSKLWLTTIEGLGLGLLGVDHLFAGNLGSFLLKLGTLGGGGVWWLVDYCRVMVNALSESREGVLGFHRWSDNPRASKQAAVVSMVALAIVVVALVVFLLVHLTRRQ